MKKTGALCLIFSLFSWGAHAGFDDLPDEIILYVLRKLPLQDVQSFGITSRGHHALSQDDSLWSEALSEGVKLTADDLKKHQEDKGESFSYKSFIAHHRKDADYYFKTHPNPILFVIENQLGGSETKRFKTYITYGKDYIVDDGSGGYATSFYQTQIVLDASNVVDGRFHHIRKNQVSEKKEIRYLASFDWYYDQKFYSCLPKTFFIDDKREKKEDKEAKILSGSKVELVREQSNWYFFNSNKEKHSVSRPMTCKEKREYKERAKGWKSFPSYDWVYEEPKFSLVITPDYLKK